MSTMYELERKFSSNPLRRDMTQGTTKRKEDSYVVVDTDRKIENLLRIQPDWNKTIEEDETR